MSDTEEDTITQAIRDAVGDQGIIEPIGRGEYLVLRLSETVCELQTAYQHLTIADTEAYGRVLFLDRLMQSTELDERMYHEALIHPAVVLHGGVKRALVAGAGEGASMRELLRYPEIEQIVAVDLDAEVVEVCKRHLPSWHQGSFDDPRVEMRYEDIQVTLAGAADGSFDFIVLDITDPIEDGPSCDLFTVKFFREVERVLADDGIIVLQSGELDIPELTVVRAVRTTLLEVYPWVYPMTLHMPSFNSLWSLTLIAKRELSAVPEDLDERVARLPLDELIAYDAGHHRALMHMPKFIREGVEQPGKIITGDDDERLVTYVSTQL